MIPVDGPERRTLVGLTKEEKERFIQHMALEEQREVLSEQRFQALEEELKPIRKLYHATLGAIAVGGFLISVLLYIYHGDRGVMQQAVEVLGKHTIFIEQLLIRYDGVQKDLDRLERHLERPQP